MHGLVPGKQRAIKGAATLATVLAGVFLFCHVAMADVVLINLSPNRGMVGSVVTMTARGLDTTDRNNNVVHINGVEAPVMRVYAVTGSNDLYKLLFHVPPNVVSTPINQPLKVDVSVEVNGEVSNTLPFTLYPSPAISEVNPDSGVQGESLDIDIHVVNTRLGRGRVSVSLGDGISVSNAKVTGPSTVKASITIADDARVGSRSLTLRMGRMLLKKIDAFTVNTANGQGGGLTLNVDEPPSLVFTKSVNISGSVNSSGGGGNTAVSVPVFIKSLTPSEAAQGEVMDVAFEGLNTHFVQGVTQVSFGNGIEVKQITITSPTSGIAKVKVADDAQVGSRRFIAITNAEEATSVIAFNIEPGSMTIKGKVTDEQGTPVSGALVSIKGIDLRVTTDANGTFVINNAPAGTQELIVNAQNFAPVEIHIEGKNGDTLDLTSATISLERKASPPSDTSSVNIYSILARGANSLVAPPGIEEAKQRIIDTIIAVGGKDLGVLDEQGRQLNPQITGNGAVSLTKDGLDRLAKAWAIQGRVLRLTSALILFNSIVGWDPEPPSFAKWIKAINEFLTQVWQAPSKPGNSLFVAIFNKGSVISSSPPHITPDTTLNPLQMYLFVNGFAVYLDKKFYSPSTGSVSAAHMLAELGPKLRKTMSDTDQPILLADGEDNNSGASDGLDNGIASAYKDLVSNIEGIGIGYMENSLIERIFDIYTSLPDAEKVKAFLTVRGLEESMGAWERWSGLVQGFVTGVVGNVVQQIYNPILNKMKEQIVKSGVPHPPGIQEAFAVRTVTGVNVILVFKPCSGDHGQNTIPKFYYTIYRKDRNAHVERLAVKPSSYFPRTKDGYLVFVDDSPPVGVNTYYLQCHLRRSQAVLPPSLSWGTDLVWNVLTAGLPAGGLVLNLLKDSLGIAYDVFHDTQFQSSGLSSISLIVYPVVNDLPSIDIAVDRLHNKEYVSIGPTGKIYVNTSNGWEPVIDTYFKEPHQKGLAVDSQGWLYTENAASEERFGGRVFGFRDPFNVIPSPDNTSHGDRFYLGEVNYYSPVLLFARPCNVSDMFMGRFSRFLHESLRSYFDPESIALIDLGKQAVKILNRRKGMPLDGSERNVSQRILATEEGFLTPFSRIGQNPLDKGACYFITSKNNIFYFYAYDPSTAHSLFSGSNFIFGMLSDLVFDDLGDLYFLDNQTGKLFLVPRQILEQARAFDRPVDEDDVIELPYSFERPLSIDISADGMSLLVGDMKGIHRIPLFVPCKTSVDATVLVEMPGGTQPALRQGDYLLLPPYTKTVTVVPPTGPERVVNLCSLDSLDPEPLREPTDQEPEVVQQSTAETYSFSVSVPADAAGKLLIRNIEIPCSRIVEQGQEVNLPDPAVIQSLIVPQENMIKPLIIFSPAEVKGDNSSVDIKGIVRNASVDSVELATDSGESRNINVTNHIFETTITPHSQANILWITINRQGEPPLTRMVVLREKDVPKATVSGVVVDSKTFMPVREARIYIPEIDTEVYTDCSGYYRVTVPAGQDITFVVSQ